MMSPDSNKPEESASYTFKCTSCGYRNPPQNSFCGRCGQALSKVGTSVSEEKPGTANSQVSHPPLSSPLPSPGYATQTPPQTLSQPTSQPAPQASLSTTKTSPRAPTPNRQSSPAEPPPPDKPTKGSNRANKWMPYALGCAALLVVCCIVSGGIWLVRNFRGFPSLGADTKPPNYGAFLKENGKFIEMTLYQGGPDSGETTGIPQTKNTQPLIILWYPETNLDYLQLFIYESGSVPYNVTPKSDGILEIRAQAPLVNGRHCLIQGGPDIPYVLIPSWCFRVGLGTSSGEESVSQEGKLKFSTQNVRIGEEALAAINEDDYLHDVVHPITKEGWQVVLTDVIIENIGQTPIEIDWDIEKKLIDSGGYQRELETFGILGAHWCAQNKYYWLPGIRYKSQAVAQIPINQTPSSLNIRINGYQSGDLDLNEPTGNLAVPFDYPPTSIPLAQSGMMEYTTEEYSFRIKDFKRILDESDKWFYLLFTLEAENSGGFDLDNSKLSDLLKLVGMTDQGDLVGHTSSWLKLDTVPPGQTGQTVNKIAISKETKWVWLAILGQDCKGVIQIIIPVQ